MEEMVKRPGEDVDDGRREPGRPAPVRKALWGIRTSDLFSDS